MKSISLFPLSCLYKQTKDFLITAFLSICSFSSSFHCSSLTTPLFSPCLLTIYTYTLSDIHTQNMPHHKKIKMSADYINFISNIHVFASSPSFALFPPPSLHPITFVVLLFLLFLLLLSHFIIYFPYRFSIHLLFCLFSNCSLPFFSIVYLVFLFFFYFSL